MELELYVINALDFKILTTLQNFKIKKNKSISSIDSIF